MFEFSASSWIKDGMFVSISRIRSIKGLKMEVWICSCLVGGGPGGAYFNLLRSSASSMVSFLFSSMSL